jgi:hypothetical protein
MELLRNYGVSSSKILVGAAMLLFLAGCSVLTPEPKIVTVTDVQKTTVPTVARPKPINLTDTRLYVVNEDNLEEFLSEFEEVNGNRAFVAFSVKDYENLALNIAELRRYIKQQGEIILYYEEAVSPKE